MERKNVIVDGNNLLFVSIANTEFFYKNNKNRYRKDLNGVDVSSLYRFMVNLSRIIEQETPIHECEIGVYVCWDMKLVPETPNWRKVVYPQYKANRDPDDPDRKSILDIAKALTNPIREILESAGIHHIQPLEGEADDTIFFLKNYLEGDNVVVSGDQDMYQCVDERTKVFNFKKSVNDYITLENWNKYCPVDKEFFPHYKAIMGDSSDNIAGLYNFGPVYTKELIENWETRHDRLSQEQLDTIDLGLSIVDLSAWKPSDKEKALILRQIERTLSSNPLSVKLGLLQVLTKYELVDNMNNIMDNLDSYINNL